jgi:two-component system cell cycle sensor histidine kinase/response regulator CckA
VAVLLQHKGQQTVLIVEDEPVARNLILMVLAGKNCHVLEADSAAEALQVSSTFDGAINLIITSGSLQTMTGRQLVEQMQQNRPQLKVFHIPSDLRENLMQEEELIPSAAFLGKRFLQIALIEKVRQILGCTPE